MGMAFMIAGLITCLCGGVHAAINFDNSGGDIYCSGAGLVAISFIPLFVWNI
jgi:hypothetical protein